MLSLQALLKAMTEKGASDLHLTAGSPPRLRIDNQLVRLQTDALSPVDTKTLCYSVMNDAQKLRFEEDLEIDFSFGIRGMARFRANVYVQQACVAGAFRIVPYKITPLEDLGLPPVVTELCDRPRGLVLVTGPTGSGKSTTLASMIDRINTKSRGHIVTIEDPIEFQHQHKGCLINQREIGRDSQSFKRALKYILRQDPDVVLIGEMRD
ncbi:MAG TPA: ATPase, T2SS/T4P/T4SS family, partial [Kofleriaceae bacterium]